MSIIYIVLQFIFPPDRSERLAMSGNYIFVISTLENVERLVV